jgi:hypothetical protein
MLNRLLVHKGYKPKIAQITIKIWKQNTNATDAEESMILLKMLTDASALMTAALQEKTEKKALSMD